MAADTTTQPATAADVLGDNVALLSAEVRRVLGVWAVGGDSFFVRMLRTQHHPAPASKPRTVCTLDEA